jgi:hypothetical protein
MEEKDEYTGVEAQRDSEFGVPGNTVQNLEDSLELEDFNSESYSSTLDNYERFIILQKRELTQFLRAVEPLTKATVDQYGKSLQISSIDADTVELKYANTPYHLSMRVNNKSQKMITTFCVHVSLLKRLVTEAYTSLAIVETEEGYSIAVCDSLLFLETLQLSDEEYAVEKVKPTLSIDREMGIYTFKKIGSVLSFSDRTSEKVIVVKEKDCYFNTGVFSARVNSPFASETTVLLYKAVVDLLGILMDISKVEVKYAFVENKLIVEADGLIYCEMPVSTKIDEHFSPTVAKTLEFTADIVIVNDSMPRLFSLVKSLDYLSDIVTVSFTKDTMKVTLSNQGMTRHSDYPFMISEGTVEQPGEMKVSADVMKPYLDVTGTDVRYAFNEVGLCMQNDKGSFIVRKNN